MTTKTSGDRGKLQFTIGKKFSYRQRETTAFVIVVNCRRNYDDGICELCVHTDLWFAVVQVVSVVPCFCAIPYLLGHTSFCHIHIWFRSRSCHSQSSRHHYYREKSKAG